MENIGVVPIKIKMHVIVLVLSRSVMSDSFVAPWTVGLQAPLSMGFPRQEYWSGLPFSSPGDIPHPGIEPTAQQKMEGLTMSIWYSYWLC